MALDSGVVGCSDGGSGPVGTWLTLKFGSICATKFTYRRFASSIETPVHSFHAVHLARSYHYNLATLTLRLFFVSLRQVKRHLCN